MDDARGRFLGLPHGTTPAAVTTNKNIKMSSFKSSENIQKKEGGPDRSVSDFLRQFFKPVFNRGYVCAIIVLTRTKQLPLQLSMKQFDVLPTQYRHIEYMHVEA